MRRECRERLPRHRSSFDFGGGENISRHSRRKRNPQFYISGKSSMAYAPVTSHSRAPNGLFPGCFELKSYVHSRGPHGSRAAPYEFCLPVEF